jgi:plasmid stabilization system protein ParE
MKFSFHPDAKEELDGAVEYYEQCQAGLGLEFAEEAYAAIARIIQYPVAWSSLSQNSRRCLISRFPYGIIYQIKSHTVRIVAVAHLSRRPGYWKERLGQDTSSRRTKNTQR